MTDAEFIKTIGNILRFITDELDKNDSTGEIEVDFDGEILSITSSSGVFLLNKQLYVREIWLSSPISGPHHFRNNEDGRWVSKNGDELFTILSLELNHDFNYYTSAP